jgi:hypothetical protein
MCNAAAVSARTLPRNVCKRMTVGRNHLLQLTRPDSVFQSLCKTSLDNLDHNPHRGGGARGGSQHGDHRTVGGSHKFPAEFQNASMHGVPFDDLNALACLLNVPILLVYFREELTKRGESLFREYNIDLGIVARGNGGIVAAKPDATHRKSGVTTPLRDIGLLW